MQLRLNTRLKVTKEEIKVFNPLKELKNLHTNIFNRMMLEFNLQRDRKLGIKKSNFKAQAMEEHVNGVLKLIIKS
ncbi:MAG: hypothetical protein LBP40_06730 [Campylobacteraceae bacterium]|jgi:hypothetical protein|nr:hypothetical protein [Campylobacteraceae bacterium]